MSTGEFSDKDTIIYINTNTLAVNGLNWYQFLNIRILTSEKVWWVHKTLCRKELDHSKSMNNWISASYFYEVQYTTILKRLINIDKTDGITVSRSYSRIVFTIKQSLVRLESPKLVHRIYLKMIRTLQGVADCSCYHCLAPSNSPRARGVLVSLFA